MTPLAKVWGLVCLALLLAVGCGPRTPRRDGGEEEDAGVDAGVPDAGRPAGEDPPKGYSLAVKSPEDGGVGSRIGVGLSMALDQHAQPLLAYLHEDPNGDGIKQDGTLVFTRWNGVDKKFQALKVVDTVAEVASAHPLRQVSVARDAVTGRLGIAYVSGSAKIRVATSDDEGESWDLATVTPPSSSEVVASPALALSGGTFHLAYWKANERCGGAGCGAVVYRTGSSAAGLSSAVAPLPAGATENPNLPLALGLDAQGKVGIAYFAASSPTNVSLGFWRPPSTSVTAVVESTNAQPDPSVSLAFFGEKPRLAYHLNGADPQVQLRYSAATDAAGTSWAGPVAIPRNSGAGSTDGTQWYQSLAVDGSSTKVAIAAYYASAVQPNLQCGGPKLARSSDDTTFAVCSPDNGRFFGFAGLWSNLAFARGGKLMLAFFYESRSNPNLPGGGVVLWREP